MASRRLAISSLLCSDEGNPSSPSPTSSPTSARTSTARDFEPVDRLSRHHPAFSAQTSGVHTRTAPTHHPLSDAKHTPAVDRLRSYNDNDVLRYLPTTYPPQLGHGREPSASPEHLPTQHQQTYPMSPYNAQSSPQPNPWSGHSPLYPRSSTSSSQDHCFPLTQSPVESKSRSFSNSSTHLTHYPPQSTSTFSPFNPSTVSPQPPPSLGGGLEALAQAASQERRRLSNEIAESMRSASRESSTRITTVVQHPVASPSTSEHRVREPAPTWRRRSKHHPEPPHKRRKSYDLLDEPIPAEPLEIFQPNRPPMDRNSLMRISTLVPDLPPLDRIYTPQKSQRSPTLPRISDIRHGVGTGPTIPIANLLTNDSPPRRITSPPHPRPPLPLQTTPSPVAQKAPTSPLSRSPTTPQRSPFLVDDLQKLPSELREPYRSPSTPVVPIPNHPVIGHIFSKVRSPPSTVEELVEGAEQVHNVPISPTPVQESSEPPTPSPVIPVEMHPSLSPSSIEDQPPTPVRLASSVAEFEPEPVPTLESPVPQLSTAVTKTEPEPEQASEPPSVLDPPSAPDVEKEQVASPNIEPPRQISIISISTPLPPPPYASHVLPMPGPGVRPPSPIPTPDYPESRHSLVQPELEHNLDPEARNDDEGTESDNMTVDIEFDLATNVADDNTIEGMRTDSEYNIEMDVDDDPLRLVNGDVTGTGPKDDDGGRVGASRYKNNAQGTNTLDARFDHAVPPPMDLEKIMREQGQPRILYQQLQGPGQPLVPLIVHEPPPEPKPEPKPTTKGKKKQPTKPPARPKQPAKIRAKGNTKVKVDTLQAQSALETVSYTGSGRMTKAPAVLSLPVTNLNSSAVGAAAARSRSQSTMPVAGENLDDKQVEKDEMDDKVYCICRAEYEEGKVMIACDRCDEWYHMQCLGMSDLDVDLVDQFFCLPCIQNNPTLPLKTTYKARCFTGVKHKNPSSPEACRKPARGAFSKYCSDECGVNFMQTKIEVWTAGGGHKAKLWETVKDADAREGVTTVLSAVKAPATVKTEADEDGDVEPTDGTLRDTKPECQVDGPATAVKKGLNKQKGRELVRLRKELEKVVDLRNFMKQELEIIEWRDSLIKLATQRSEEVGECGWDQRLCMDDEEWIEAGPAILENYDGHDQQDDESESFVEWWCRGKKKCDRHAGWQRLRVAEVEFEIHQKDLGLKKLAETERDIRRRIEDIMDPHLALAQVEVNDEENKVKMNGGGKTAKKRKATG